MEINKLNDKKTTFSITRDELAKMLNEKFLDNDEKFLFKSNLPYNINIDFFFNYITIQTEQEIQDRKQSLERAKNIKMEDILDEFKATATPLNKLAISQFYNALQYPTRNKTLDYILSLEVTELSKFRRVGVKTVELFELFLKEKGFRFAFHDGEKLV